jgi:hypothetical protein
MFFDDSDPIEFLCAEEDWDVIPKPYRAGKLTPEWFKKLPGKINGIDKLTNSTIKRCAPFLDAMTAGWIIPLAADIEIVTSNGVDEWQNPIPADRGPGLGGVNFKHNFHKPMIESHTQEQISTPEAPNPNNPKPPMKFLNHWLIKAKPGWSVLFMPPLNRPDERFECISAIVDCDGYFEFINFPFFFHKPNWTGIIEAGTPLVQVIPFKRSKLPRNAVVRKMDPEDHKRLNLTRRRRNSHESFYRDHVWTKK